MEPVRHNGFWKRQLSQSEVLQGLGVASREGWLFFRWGDGLVTELASQRDTFNFLLCLCVFFFLVCVGGGGFFLSWDALV